MDKRIAAALAAAIFGSAALAAQPTTPKQPPGPGARGPGMMGGYGHGWGPGMMGGYGQGWGPGMMGGWGPGMMGGWGPGMMGGWGPGWGGADLNLNSEQRDKVEAIQRELRNKQFALMDKMHDQFRSSDMYRDGKLDDQAARRAYDAAEKLHRQMFENMLEARKRMDAVLTPQQRQQLGEGAK